MSAQFPDVPNAPGVPPVNRDPSAPPDDSSPTVLSQDDPSVTDSSSAPQWGIFDSDGNQILFPDSVISFEVIEEFKILDYPVEEGGFESYNKVQRPFQVRFVFSKGGSTSDRADFISTIRSITNDLNLYDCVIPELSYQNANVIRNNFGRKREGGAYIILAEVWLQAVNVTVTANLASTKNPASQDAVNGGPVQAQPATAAQIDAIINGPMQQNFDVSKPT